MYKLLIVWLLSWFCVISETQAAHIIGGEVTYTCISSSSVTKQTIIYVNVHIIQGRSRWWGFI
jgi:hypothetical protein